MGKITTLARASSFFCTFLGRSCTTKTRNDQISSNLLENGKDEAIYSTISV